MCGAIAAHFGWIEWNPFEWIFFARFTIRPRTCCGCGWSCKTKIYKNWYNIYPRDWGDVCMLAAVAFSPFLHDVSDENKIREILFDFHKILHFMAEWRRDVLLPATDGNAIVQFYEQKTHHRIGVLLMKVFSLTKQRSEYGMQTIAWHRSGSLERTRELWTFDGATNNSVSKSKVRIHCMFASA